MTYLRWVLAVLLCQASGGAFAADAYLCITRMVSGFSYDQARGVWHPSELKGGAKYLVSRSSAPGTAWQVVPVGEVAPSAFCKDDFSRAGVLTCRGFDDFKMNRINGRFMHAYLVGYWTDQRAGVNQRDPSLFREGENAPFVELGEYAAR